MRKQIKLPGGVIFDPETGEIQGGNFGRTHTVARGLSQSARHNTYRRRYNLWDRFNNFISEIGNWIAERSEMITNYCGMGLFILSWIGFALSIISTWISQGVIWALIAGIIGGGIFYYVSMILLGIFIFVMNIVLAIIRYLFYNAYTFLLTLAIIAILLFAGYNSARRYRDYNNTVNTQHTMPQTTRYYCTARSVLNIRSAPNMNARVIGTLNPNQTVEVYEIIDGFARIKYGTDAAYVSLSYLKKVIN